MYDVDVSSFAAIQILLRIYCVFVALLKGQKSGNRAVPAMSAFSGIFQHGPRIGAGRLGRPFLYRKFFPPLAIAQNPGYCQLIGLEIQRKKKNMLKQLQGLLVNCYYCYQTERMP
jgi:hypothetical protein